MIYHPTIYLPLLLELLISCKFLHFVITFTFLLREDPLTILVGWFSIGIASKENNMENPHKNERQSNHDPAFPLLGIYPK